MSTLRFPPRQSFAIWLIREAGGAWLVLARGHGWLFGSRHEAVRSAEWLAENLALPVRVIPF